MVVAVTKLLRYKYLSNIPLTTLPPLIRSPQRFSSRPNPLASVETELPPLSSNRAFETSRLWACGMFGFGLKGTQWAFTRCITQVYIVGFSPRRIPSYTSRKVQDRQQMAILRTLNRTQQQKHPLLLYPLYQYRQDQKFTAGYRQSFDTYALSNRASGCLPSSE